MAIFLKKNTAGQHVYGLITGSGGDTGLTIAVTRAIDGGAYATCTGTVVEDGDGMYHLVTSAADTNGTNIGFVFTAAPGAVRTNFMVQAQTVGIIWDEPTANHTTTGSMGKAVGDAAAGITASAVAAAVWSYLTSAITTVGSIGVLLKTQLDVAVSTRLSEADYTGAANGDIAAIRAKTDNLPGAPAAVSDIPSANAVADALLDRTDGVQSSWTVRQALRVVLAALAGKLSGAGTGSVLIRDPGDSKNRISATCDVDGNRTTVTYDKT